MDGLYKAHSTDDYFDDFGLIVSDTQIHFMENGVTRVSRKLKLSPVLKMGALWMDKDIRLICGVADTLEKKRIGLQHTPSLEDNEGLYFPYPGKANVTFHQGSVPYSLDIMFIADDSVIQMETHTVVGSSNKWQCNGCDGVIEVNSGFCESKNVEVGDRIAFFATSEQDIVEYTKEAYEDSLLTEDDRRRQAENNYYKQQELSAFGDYYYE